MKAFTEYNEVEEYSNVPPMEKIPAGAYEARLIRAEEKDNALCILFDIAEGEFKDYYFKRFEADKKAGFSNVKFKGVLRLWYPTDKDSDEVKLYKNRAMKTALKLIKDENRLNIDYTKEWNGGAFKNCKIGIILREQEWRYRGDTGFTAQPFKLISLSDLKEGNFVIPDPKRLNDSTAQSVTTSAVENPLDDEDLPFI